MTKLMAKHRCGHEAHYDLHGAEAALRREFEWLEGQPCQDCRAPGRPSGLPPMRPRENPYDRRGNPPDPE
jgi:hypothetical protein